MAFKEYSHLNMTSVMTEIPHISKTFAIYKVGSKNYFYAKTKKSDFSTKMGYILPIVLLKNSIYFLRSFFSEIPNPNLLNLTIIYVVIRGLNKIYSFYSSKFR